MAKPDATPDRPRCPRCGEDGLITYDPRTGLRYCAVCAHTWREA
jgi:hypothetical protein